MRAHQIVVLLGGCLTLAGCPGEADPPTKVQAAPTKDAPSGGSGEAPDGDLPAGAVEAPAQLSSGEGADSPADCFYRMKRAYDSKQFGEYWDVLSPDSRTRMLPTLSIFCGLVTGGQEQAMQDYKQLLASYGLEDLGEDKEPAEPAEPAAGDDASGGGMDFKRMSKEFDGVEDKRALFADLFQFLTKSKAGMGDTERVVGLEALKVDGDTASGKLILRDDAGNEKRDLAEFRKIDGRWFAHVSMGQ